MNRKHEPTLGQVLHVRYPFIMPRGFDWRTGELEIGQLQWLMHNFSRKYLKRDGAEKFSGSQQNSLLEHVARLQFSDNGTALAGIAMDLKSGKEIRYQDPVTEIRFNIRRFGQGLGVNVVDRSGSGHVAGKAILGLLATTGEYDHLIPFVSMSTIGMPRWQAYGNNRVSVGDEIKSLIRYVPSVDWTQENPEKVASSLVDDYIRNSHDYRTSRGIKVGEWCRIPVYMYVKYDNDNTDTNWRRGAVRIEGDTLIFDGNEHLEVVYVFRIADAPDSNSDLKMIIDRGTEQSFHRELSQLLLNGCAARHLTETQANNPHLCEWWREEEV